MVSAMRYISEKEGLLDVTRFYLAEPVDEVPLYEYKNLGNDIDPVFESFNESFATNLSKVSMDAISFHRLFEVG